MGKMDLTALRIRDELYAVDKGAGKPWTGTVADLAELTGSDKRRVPDAIFQLIDSGTPIEYRNGIITYAGVTKSESAQAFVTVTTADVLTFDEIAERVKSRAAARRAEKWAAETSAGQLTIFDIPDAPERPTTRISETTKAKTERFPTQTAAALRIRPAEQRSNGATKQRSNEATKQRSNGATEQRSNEATKQRSNEATEQRSNGCTVARLPGKGARRGTSG